MNRSSTLSILVLLISVINLTATTAWSQKLAQRQAWQFETVAGKRTIVDHGNRRWVTYYPNGTTAECEELDRTPEYLEIRNAANQAVLRLYGSFGTVRKTPEGPFKRFAAGHWLQDEDAPASASPFGTTDYKIRVVYFVPQDRKPTSNYQDKIDVVLTLISDVMTRDLRSKGLETDGPQFEQRDGKTIVHLLRGNKKAREYSDLPNFNSVRHFTSITGEVERRLGSLRDHIVVIFAETYEDGPADRVWAGHVARAVANPPNGGGAVFSAWMLRDELCATDIPAQRRGFVDPTPIRGRTAIGHRGPDSPRSEFIEDGIGGMLHELAHTFGLPHDHRAKRVDIMGEGFRNLRWNVTPTHGGRQHATFSNESAWLLMASRYLNSSVNRADNQPPQARLEANRNGQGVSLTVTATDEHKLAAVVVLDHSGQDRKLIAGQRLSGKRQIIKQELPWSLLPSGNVRLQVIVVDSGGNHTKLTGINL